MIKLLRIFSGALAILTNQFILVYPLLFFILVVSFVLPQEVPAQVQPTWMALSVALGVVLVALHYVLMAGWYRMIAFAVASFSGFNPPASALSNDNTAASTDNPAPVSISPVKGFGLLKEFLPGIGEFWGPFLWGGFFQVGAMALIVVAAWYYLDLQQAIPSEALMNRLVDHLNTVASNSSHVSSNAYQSALTLLKDFSDKDINTLTTFFSVNLIGFVAYGLFYLATVFWGPFVVLQQKTSLVAFGKSLLCFLKDPFRVLVLGLFYILSAYGLMALTQFGQPFLIVMSQFLVLILNTYFAILVFAYLKVTAPALFEGLLDKAPTQQGVSTPQNAP